MILLIDDHSLQPKSGVNFLTTRGPLCVNMVHENVLI